MSRYSWTICRSSCSISCPLSSSTWTKRNSRHHVSTGFREASAQRVLCNPKHVQSPCGPKHHSPNACCGCMSRYSWTICRSSCSIGCPLSSSTWTKRNSRHLVSTDFREASPQRVRCNPKCACPCRPRHHSPTCSYDCRSGYNWPNARSCGSKCYLLWRNTWTKCSPGRPLCKDFLLLLKAKCSPKSARPCQPTHCSPTCNCCCTSGCNWPNAHSCGSTRCPRWRNTWTTRNSRHRQHKDSLLLPRGRRNPKRVQSPCGPKHHSPNACCGCMSRYSWTICRSSCSISCPLSSSTWMKRNSRHHVSIGCLRCDRSLHASRFRGCHATMQPQHQRQEERGQTAAMKPAHHDL